MAFEDAGWKAGSFTIKYEDLDDATAAEGKWTAEKEAANADQAISDPDVIGVTIKGFTVEGFPNNGKTGLNKQWWNLSPRAGVAWDVHGDGRLAVRSSYAMAYDFMSGEYHNISANAPPIGARHAISPSRISARPSVPIIFTSGSRRAKAGPKTIP